MTLLTRSREVDCRSPTATDCASFERPDAMRRDQTESDVPTPWGRLASVSSKLAFNRSVRLNVGFRRKAFDILALEIQ